MKNIKRILLIIILCFLSSFPIKCAYEQISCKIKMNQAKYIIENYQKGSIFYQDVVKKIGKPMIKNEKIAEFFIKPEAIIGIAYTSLIVIFDENEKIVEAYIDHPD